MPLFASQMTADSEFHVACVKAGILFLGCSAMEFHVLLAILKSLLLLLQVGRLFGKTMKWAYTPMTAPWLHWLFWS